MTPEDVLKAYETEIDRRDFDLLVPLISENAVFWFTDGSHLGLAAIRRPSKRPGRPSKMKPIG